MVKFVQKYFKHVKNILFILFLFLSISLHSQISDTEIIRIENNTVYSIDRVFMADKKLCHEKYYKMLEDEMHKSKEHLFIVGKTRFYSLDSMKIYSYDVNGQLIDANMIDETDLMDQYNFFPYSDTEIGINEESLSLEGRENKSKCISIELSNLTPQNYSITLNSTSPYIDLPSKSINLRNRTSKYIELKVKLQPGVNDINLMLDNSNKKSKLIKINTVGYHLTQSDFSPNKNRLVRRKFKAKEAIYIETKGNYKLLKIENRQSEIIYLPVSKKVNKIDAHLLKKGKYLLELKNLQTNESLFCKMKII